jgi:putative transposase
MSVEEKRAAIEPAHPVLSVSRQCEILSLPRSTLYYRPAPALSAEDERLMRLVDEEYTARPFYGSRRMRAALARRGERVGRRRVRRLMALMGLKAVYPKPNLSRPNKHDARYPYLLRGVPIVRANQVWSSDITYIRLRSGFVYLVVVIDWWSRRVLSWRLSTTLDSDFCVEALKEALAGFGRPEIFNTDQGSQFTSEAFVKPLIETGVRISRDGRGRALDNVFVERLWRSLKSEEVYLKDYATPNEARRSIGEWFDFYNHSRPHQSLDYRTPGEVYGVAAPESSALGRVA